MNKWQLVGTDAYAFETKLGIEGYIEATWDDPDDGQWWEYSVSIDIETPRGRDYHYKTRYKTLRAAQRACEKRIAAHARRRVKKTVSELGRLLSLLEK